jgi:ACDE family multidrug resistance protein
MNIDKRNIIFIFSISIMAILGIVSVTPSLPYVAADLNIPKDKIGLIVSLFAMPGIFFTPVYGILADKFGRKKVLVPSLLMFGIFGTAGFFVRDFNLLLVLRFLSGMGAASLGALNVTLIGDLFSGDKRQKIVGYNNSALNFGTTIVPIIGGMLAMIHWNYVYILPLLAVALALWMIYSFEEPVSNTKSTADYFKGFINALKNYKISMMYLLSLLVYIIHFGSLWTYIPFLIKNKFTDSSVIFGLVLAGMSLTASLISIFFGKIASKHSSGKLFAAAFAFLAVGLVSVTFMTEWYLLFVSMVIYGAGFGIILPNIQSTVIKLAPENHRGVIVSLNRTISLLGQFLGPVISGFILYLYPTGVEGIHLLFYVFAGLAVITLGVSQLAFINKNENHK